MEDLSLQLPDIHLAGLRYGAGNPRKMLAIHGWLDNAASFYVVAPLLADCGFEIVAIDLPGHGRSQHRPPGSNYHLVDYLREVRQVIDLLGWQNPILAGHSLGGIIASLYCAAIPEEIDKLILLESLGPLTAKVEDTTKNLRKALVKTTQPVSRKRVYASVEDAIEDRQRGFGEINKVASRPLVERNLVPVEGGWVWCTDTRLRRPSFIRFTEEQVEAYLSDISVPTLLVAASDGYIPTNPAKNPRLAYIQNATIRRVAGDHHFHMDGEVKKIVEYIAEFCPAANA